jgi:hypothetical protein
MEGHDRYHLNQIIKVIYIIGNGTNQYHVSPVTIFQLSNQPKTLFPYIPSFVTHFI